MRERPRYCVATTGGSGKIIPIRASGFPFHYFDPNYFDLNIRGLVACKQFSYELI